MYACLFPLEIRNVSLTLSKSMYLDGVSGGHGDDQRQPGSQEEDT